MQRRPAARRAISGCGPLTIHFPPLYSSVGAAVDDDDEDHQELRSFYLCPSRLEIPFFFVFFFIFPLLFYSPSLQWAILFFPLFSWTLSLSLAVCSKGIWSQSISGPCQENELDLPSLSPLFWKFCVYKYGKHLMESLKPARRRVSHSLMAIAASGLSISFFFHKHFLAGPRLSVLVPSRKNPEPRSETQVVVVVDCRARHIVTVGVAPCN